MIVSQYFVTIDDYIKLECVCKKYKCNMARFHFNPIQINKKTIKYFPNIKTLNLWSFDDENFGNNLIIPFPEEKIVFFKINIWFRVGCSVAELHENTNISFKNIIYLKKERKLGIEMSKNTNELASNCFQDSKKVVLQIPNSVTSIENCCFMCCKLLTSITLSNNLQSIGDSCFEQCTSLVNINIPKRVNKFGVQSFDHCLSLKKITIPHLIKEIPEKCFYQCASLKIVLPNTPILLKDQCFDGCKHVVYQK
ncbi:hypothetical protein EIN_201020 [Entamoeba invadens IP1]|uniref:Leucine rich repeat containing protein BspA family protein n=1 Tax=Entamoeba invadens IP1 TaxID=370355 RepID=A0A0A1U902_ENTIV|nr:hypothetical protein EIN_201020 [Entamoeba invadens IP1]ELP89617.1 hypothetical protein EIN_201020 [Entamoeba invadens IP1]|eukprot:XP_004256388.1 hypothetical protein EIN_201020 [Entamoeba invadens IP1]